MYLGEKTQISITERVSKLGVKHKIIQGYVHAKAPNGLVGNNIKLSKISVGATENALLAAFNANGKTILKNCAIEPEVKDLVIFLRKLGRNIKKEKCSRVMSRLYSLRLSISS